MLLLDVNVLLAAYRDDHPNHQAVRPWFDRLLAADDPFIDAVTAQPHHLPTGPGPRHLALLRSVCDEADATGDLIPDAVLAAIAVEHHCDVVTLDRDFARFTSVRVIRPSSH